MPRMDGMDMIETIKRKSPETKIIALTVHRGEEYVLATLKAGADGYVLKEANYAELSMAIKNVLKGKHYLSPEISGKLIEGYLDGRKSLKIESVWEALTKRRARDSETDCRGPQEQGDRRSTLYQRQHGGKTPVQHHGQVEHPQYRGLDRLRHGKGTGREVKAITRSFP